ncbi:MAG: ArsR/SmtB family transcription factor [Candidatus Saccharibacteria bacterium]
MEPFAALADPTRLRIFELIVQGERTVGEIVNQFSFKPPTISQHLQVLKRAKLVRVRAEGQKRIYAADEAGFKELEVWMNEQRSHWNHKLDALERYLETDA